MPLPNSRVVISSKQFETKGIFGFGSCVSLKNVPRSKFVSLISTDKALHFSARFSKIGLFSSGYLFLKALAMFSKA